MAMLLEFHQGSEKVVAHELPEDKSFAIGRGKGNALTLLDVGVSRTHARISPNHQGYRLEDQCSSNGTFVNGNPVGKCPYQLKDNDRITLGNPAYVTMLFRATDETLKQVEQRRQARELNKVVELEVDVNSWTVRIRGETPNERLPAREFCLLECLWKRQPFSVTMTELKAAGWPDLPSADLEMVANETIHTYIYRVRRYLRMYGLERPVIMNVRGIGYRLEPAAGAVPPGRL